MSGGMLRQIQTNIQVGPKKLTWGLRLVNNTISSQSQRLVSSVPSDTVEREIEFIRQVHNIDNTYELLQWQAASGGISPS